MKEGPGSLTSRSPWRTRTTCNPRVTREKDSGGYALRDEIGKKVRPNQEKNKRNDRYMLSAKSARPSEGIATKESCSKKNKTRME